MYTEQKYKTQHAISKILKRGTVKGSQSIEINPLGPNLWILHDWEYRYASVGHRYQSRGLPSGAAV
jgi:hypothetical protein